MVSGISWVDEVQINRINHILRTVGGIVLEDTYKTRLGAIAGINPIDSTRTEASAKLRVYLGHYISTELKPTYRKGSWAAGVNRPIQLEALETAEKEFKAALRNSYGEIFFLDKKVNVALERIQKAAKRVNLDEITAPLPAFP